ncbi:hypothetical protein KSS87_011265, partial [Heliosperma pusillum]
APLLIGCDLRSMDEVTLEILSNKDVISVNQDEVGIQGRKLRKYGDLEVWGGPLANMRAAIVLWNKGPSPATITADLRDVYIPPTMTVDVRDLWTQRTLWPVKGELSAQVQPHDVKMFILRPTKATHH